MKQKLLLLLLSVIVISCGDNGSDSNETNSGLVKKIVQNDGETYTTNFTYSGNKIVKTVDSNGSKLVFTYTGDLITNIKTYDDNELDTEEFFTYNSNEKLISYKELEYFAEYGSLTNYVYNNDGTISTTNYSGNLTAQDDLNTTGMIYFENENVSKIESYNQGELEQSTTFSFDSKNNPINNITGFSKIAFVEDYIIGSLHNVITIDGNSFGDVYSSTYEYVYNDNGYPISAIETDSDSPGTEATSQYFY